jgi:hypothetical protein
MIGIQPRVRNPDEDVWNEAAGVGGTIGYVTRGLRTAGAGDQRQDDNERPAHALDEMPGAINVDAITWTVTFSLLGVNSEGD